MTAIALYLFKDKNYRLFCWKQMSCHWNICSKS